MGGNGDVRSGGGSAVLRRPGVPGITTPPDIGANLDYLAKIFWPGGSSKIAEGWLLPKHLSDRIYMINP